MRALAVVFLMLFGNTILAQDEVNVFGEQEGTTMVLFANNVAYCPTSLKLELELTNMKLAHPMPDHIVIPARAERFRLAEIQPVEGAKKVGYSSRIAFVLGDVGLKEPNSKYIYDLPFERGKQFVVFQGYNGKASHTNQYALDFSMPEGTPVYAAREGIVVNVRETNTQSCPQAECAQYNNFVLVYHDDGSFAEYTHLQKNGAKVSKGDKVKKGTLLGLSGSTGWTNGPHLHFVCFLSRLNSRQSFPTSFRIGDGTAVEELEEKTTYAREYR